MMKQRNKHLCQLLGHKKRDLRGSECMQWTRTADERIPGTGITKLGHNLCGFCGSRLPDFCDTCGRWKKRDGIPLRFLLFTYVAFAIHIALDLVLR